MTFTNEQLVKARQAKDADELLAFAEENGIKLSKEEADDFFAQWHTERELSDNELDNVAGGDICEDDPPEPRYSAGQQLWVGYPTTRSFLGITIQFAEFYTKDSGWRYYVTNEHGYDENYYLETKSYIFTYKPTEWPEPWH